MCRGRMPDEKVIQMNGTLPEAWLKKTTGSYDFAFTSPSLSICLRIHLPVMVTINRHSLVSSQRQLLDMCTSEEIFSLGQLR